MPIWRRAACALSAHNLMTARIIKKSWWVDFRFERTRYRRRSPDNSRAGALAYEASLRQKLARGASLANAERDGNVTFEVFAWRWFRDYVRPNNKYSEQRTKQHILANSLIPFFGKLNVADIATSDIEQYKAKLTQSGIAPKTINNRLCVLNTCLTMAYDWLQLETAKPRAKRLRCPPPRTDYLSSEECALLLSHARGTLRELILMALRTGMRQGELKGLQWDSIDWQNCNLIVRHSRCDHRRILDTPKSNRERAIPLDREVQLVLAGRRKSTGYVFLDREGKPFHARGMSRDLTMVCHEAGLRRITWHVLRHTFASQLALKGVPLHAVQALLGHTTIMTTMRYAHVAPSALRSAIELLNPKAVPSPALGQPVGNPWSLRWARDESSESQTQKSQAVVG